MLIYPRYLCRDKGENERRFDVKFFMCQLVDLCFSQLAEACFRSAVSSIAFLKLLPSEYYKDHYVISLYGILNQ